MKTTSPYGTLPAGAMSVSEVDQRSGGVFIDDTVARAGQFGAITALTATVIAALVSESPGQITGTLATMPIPAGVTIYGNFTSITLTSGKVIAYNAP